MFNGKKGEMKAWMWIGIFAVGLYLLVPGFQSTINGFFDGGDTQAVDDGSSVAQRPERCYIEDTTLTVGPAERMFAPTTKATTSYHRVIKNGVDKGLYLDGSTLTANPGDQVAIFWGENDTTYYAAKQEFTVPCNGEVTAGEMPDSNAYKMYSNGTGVTVRAFNTNDGNKNTDGVNQSLSAGDVETLDVELRGVYQKAMSPYGKIVVVIEANKSVYDELRLGSFETATKPDQHTVENADKQTWTFEIPNLISNAQLDTNLVVDVDDTVDPTAVDDAAHDILLTLYDEDWYQNSDTGVMEFGAETNRDADVGFAVTTLTIHTE